MTISDKITSVEQLLKISFQQPNTENEIRENNSQVYSGSSSIAYYN